MTKYDKKIQNIINATIIFKSDLKNDDCISSGVFDGSTKNKLITLCNDVLDNCINKSKTRGDIARAVNNLYRYKYLIKSNLKMQQLHDIYLLKDQIF